MSGTIRTPIVFGRGQLTFEGHTPSGQPIKVVFFNAQQMELDQIHVAEEWDDEILYGDGKDVAIKKTLSEFYLNIEGLRLLESEHGEIFRTEIGGKE